jgi:hypothetical protein
MHTLIFNIYCEYIFTYITHLSLNIKQLNGIKITIIDSSIFFQILLTNCRESETLKI